MENIGFTNLHGADPYISSDAMIGSSTSLTKSDVFGLKGQYDLIMLHHSFEHMIDPARVMAKLYELTAPGRYVLIRIPVADSYAWEHYRENWIQLDAPRHIFLHTKFSMDILVKNSGFRLIGIVHDSSAMQFWGSEQYLNDVALHEIGSRMTGSSSKIQTSDKLGEYQHRAKELNIAGRGDQACFYLQRPD